MVDFGIILGMSLLSPYHAILDYHDKTIIMAMLGMDRLEWEGNYIPTRWSLALLFVTKG